MKLKIYTKVGDDGYTFTLGGVKVRKDDLRIKAYGEIDELTSWLSVIVSHVDSIQDSYERERIVNFLNLVQNRLFDTGTLVIGMSIQDVKDWVSDIEKEIDYMEEKLKPIRKFILPGGSKLSSFTHVARCVCRRAEREVVELSSKVEIDKNIIMFLNRLSDYLFVLARYFNFLLNVDDIVRGESIYVKNKIKIKPNRTENT
ncbi:MAG: cob(I)yrinic acid a,c-diamide adenosyltransferase [Brevinematia bacterium]